MSHSTKAPTKAEQARMDAIALMPCICCEIDRQLQPNPTEVDHSVENGYRKHSGGHMATTPKCMWHHRGICLEDYQAGEMKMIYGPSKALHHREFKARYGTDAELLAKVNEKLARAA